MSVVCNDSQRISKLSNEKYTDENRMQIDGKKESSVSSQTLEPLLK